MRTELSVVLPVRDAEHTLEVAIGSCLRQTFPCFELLVVLNGCTDRSGDIVRQAAEQDSRVRVLESSAPGGVTGAMRTGVSAATAPFIARMDADDISYPERFAKQLAMLKADPALGAVSCGVRLIDVRGEGMQRYVDWVNGLRTPEDVARERFVECPVIQPTVMMRRRELEEAGGYRDTTWAEDHDLWLRMLHGGVRFGKVAEVLFDWRDGEARLTRSHAMYGEDQVWNMKAHHLARLEQVRDQGVAICGGGPIGKRLRRLLDACGVEVRGYFEVNPRKIGGRIGGVPVAGPAEFGTCWREAVLLSAVGVAGGRDRVRDLAQSAGYIEGLDFWCCC
jgi:glycosyltransferase involved in cell wall biosynthesis